MSCVGRCFLQQVNANVYQNLLQQHAVPSLRACSISLQFHARKYSCHTAKWVKQFLEAKNTEIMIWPAQSLDLNPIEKSLENSWWQSYGYETHYSHQTMEETGRRVDQDHTRAVWETSDVLQPQMCWSHSKHWPVHFLLISDCCNFRNFSSSCYNHCCSLILITVFSTK